MTPAAGAVARLQEGVRAGVELVGLDGTLYDQVLDTIFYLGLAPPRFQVLCLLPAAVLHQGVLTRGVPCGLTCRARVVDWQAC